MNTYSYEENRKLFKRALEVIPAGVYGHLGPTQGCAIPIEAYPIFSQKAKGAYFWDVDGNRFIDYMCAYGPIVLGYNDDTVNSAVREQMELGDIVTSPSYKMVELAELLVDTVKIADWAFFAKNGGDATSFALMVAKAATGRKKTILINGGYHGVAPWAQKLGVPGITEEDVENNLYVDWNNYEQVVQLVNQYPNEIACFMATPYHHPVFQDNELPKDDYWQKIRKICTKHGIVLAIDDVRAGFRLDISGSDQYFGFDADLLCFSKAIGNGYGFSVLCGINALKEAAASVMYTGSFWYAAIPFAASIATINRLKELNGPAIMQNMGKKLTDGLVTIGKTYGFDLSVSGVSSMWYMRITNDDSLMLHQEWIAELVRRGVYFTNHHNQFMSLAISDEDIRYTHEAADEAFNILRKNHS